MSDECFEFVFGGFAGVEEAICGVLVGKKEGNRDHWYELLMDLVWCRTKPKTNAWAPVAKARE